MSRNQKALVATAMVAFGLLFLVGRGMDKSMFQERLKIRWREAFEVGRAAAKARLGRLGWKHKAERAMDSFDEEVEKHVNHALDPGIDIWQWRRREDA